MLPLVIHIFEPLSTQSSPCRPALVRMLPGIAPRVGLGQTEAADHLARRHRGSHCCFCSSEPNAQIGNMASEPWTDTKLRTPLSPYSSSVQASPYATAFVPAQP